MRWRMVLLALVVDTFLASWVPLAAGDRAPRTLAFSLSHNRWDGQVSAFYRPTFATVAAPIFLPAGGVCRVAVRLEPTSTTTHLIVDLP